MIENALKSKQEIAASKAAEAAAENAKLNKEVDTLRRELNEARKAMAEGRGLEAEKARQAQEQLEKEREARIQHLAQNGMRRMMKGELARGWTAWHDQWADFVHKKRLLANSAMRLSKPKLAASFTHWQRDWEYEMAASALMTGEQKLTEEVKRRTIAETELTKVREELFQARKAMAEGRGLEAERERRAQEELEAERQARVEHLANVGIRRMFQQGLARGWTAWHDKWADYLDKKRLLANSAQRLARPKLVHSFVHWQKDWEYETTAKEMAKVAQRAKTDKDRIAEGARSSRLRRRRCAR